MKSWIVSRLESLNPHVKKAFQEAATQLDTKVVFKDSRKFECIESDVDSDQVYYNKKHIKLPDVLIPRIGSNISYAELSFIRHVERSGRFVINPSGAIEKAIDKYRTIQELHTQSLPTPKTMLAKFPLDTDIINSEFTYPLLLKLSSSSQGKGIIMCKDQTDLEDVANFLERSESKGTVIIQEFISESSGKDIRALVLGGRVLGCMLRSSEGKSFKSNFSLGGKVEPYPLSDEIIWLATESARTLGLNYAGVDLLLTKEGFSIAEVNSNPGFEGFEKAHPEMQVAEEILRFCQLHTGT